MAWLAPPPQVMSLLDVIKTKEWEPVIFFAFSRRVSVVFVHPRLLTDSPSARRPHCGVPSV